MPTTVAVVSIPEDEIRRARRIEVIVYVFTACALIVLGIFLTSKIMNWIVGPAFVVAMVTIITPQVLKIAGVRDPDAGTADRPTPAPEQPG